MECKCTAPGWCEAYKKNITGRLWEICQGVNVSPKVRDHYLAQWEAQAMRGVSSEEPVVELETASKIHVPKGQKCVNLHFPLCPGDTLVGTAAVECLKTQYGDRFLVSVSGTAADHIFENNPGVVKKPTDREVTEIVMEYPLINSSNQMPVHFLEGYTRFLGSKLKINLDITANRPYLYISDQENGWIPQVHEVTQKSVKYWLVCSGVKNDYTVKGWGHDNYQAVIDQTPWIQWVQVGENNHSHHPLRGVLDMRGKTDMRQLIRMAYKAEGGIGGVSLLHHIFAAFSKPFVCIASGMEAPSWERYNTETYLCKGHCLPCGKDGGCWKSRVTPLDDKDPKNDSLCSLPVFGGSSPIPKCMAMIDPREVVSAIRAYYEGGLLSH